MTETDPRLRTLGGRLAAARAFRGYKNPARLAAAMQAKGYAITRQTLAALERDSRDISAQTISDLAEFFEMPEEELRHGPRGGESYWLDVELRSIERDLEPYQRERLLYLAHDMARETQQRRETEELKSSIKEDELELIRLARTRPGMLDALLAQAQAASPNAKPSKK